MMTRSKQHGSSGVMVLIAALVVMVVGGALMWHLLQERGASPRPKTHKRYLKSSDDKTNPPAKFSDVKVDDDKLTP